MAGTGGRARRAVVAGLLVLVLGGYSPALPPQTTWAHLDPAQVGLVGTEGTLTRVDLATGTTATLRATGGASGVVVTIPALPGERYFGLGARYGALDLRGQLLHNRAADAMGHPDVPGTYSPMPFLLSSRGYGLHLDTTADAVVDLTAPDRVTIRVAAPEVAVQVFTGPDPATVLTRHAELIGLPPLPPAWGLGVWKSLIGGTDRVLADVDALLAAGVPLDAVWIYDVMHEPSGFGWPWPIYGPVPVGDYPDPAALTAQLHARGLRVLGYLRPDSASRSVWILTCHLLIFLA